MTLNYKLFKGVSVQMHDVQNAEEKASILAGHPAVKAVWPVTVYPGPKPAAVSVNKGLVAKSSSAAASKVDNFTPHVMTQVNKLRAKGFDGKGIKIAIVDTGVSGYCPRLMD